MPNSFGQTYLKLVLHLDKHVSGFVDSYFGPAALKAEVKQEAKLNLAELRQLWQAAADQIPVAPTERQQLARANLRAVGCTLDMLAGKQVSYVDEVRNIYDIELQPRREADFLEAHKIIDSILPGTGKIATRFEQYSAQHHLSPAQLQIAIETAMAECRRRTKGMIELITGESFRTAIVTNQPWSAYNWFEGNAQSLIEINTDLPTTPIGVLGLIAHEAYPGHHTEHQLKEAIYYRRHGYDEFSAAVLHSPGAVIAEGIATTALEIIFPAGSAFQWAAEELYPALGMAMDSTALSALTEARQALRYVSSNAAIRYHTGIDNEEQTIDYIMTYALSNRQSAEKRFAFLSHALYRSYVQTYTNGYDLIEAASPGDKAALFKRLLTELVLPSELAAMARQEHHHHA